MSTDRYGYVYFAGTLGEDGEAKAIKIGFSNDPSRRVKELATGSADRIVLLTAMPGSRDDEQALHQTFADDRMSGEWFASSEELREFVSRVMRVGFEMPSWQAQEPFPRDRHDIDVTSALIGLRDQFGENAELVDELACAFGDPRPSEMLKMFTQLAHVGGQVLPHGRRMEYGLRAAIRQGKCNPSYVIACALKGVEQGQVA